VSAYIMQLQSERLFKLAITADMVVQELAKIAFANIEDFLIINGESTEIKGNGKYPAAVSQRVIKVDLKTGVRTITHFSLHSKIEALCALGRNLGVFAKEAQKGKGGAPLVFTPRNKRDDGPSRLLSGEDDGPRMTDDGNAEMQILGS
jgi:phage terminase small subunit